jgi:hypothetical protein
MNLREVQLSSRSVIPIALALPINREPADTQSQAQSMGSRREAPSDERDNDRSTVSFYL